MKPPIVIIEGNDISVQPSAQHVATFLEPQDVSDGIYAAYDSEGRLLDLSVKPISQEHRFLWFRWIELSPGIVVSEHEPATDGSIELRRKLIGYLNAISKKKSIESVVPTAPLDELIRVAGKYWRAPHQKSR